MSITGMRTSMRTISSTMPRVRRSSLTGTVQQGTLSAVLCSFLKKEHCGISFSSFCPRDGRISCYLHATVCDNPHGARAPGRFFAEQERKWRVNCYQGSTHRGAISRKQDSTKRDQSTGPGDPQFFPSAELHRSQSSPTLSEELRVGI